MRMWGVSPELLCNKHLLGEHVEMHMFLGCIKKGTSIHGYIAKGLVNPSLIQIRHDELAKEMTDRGMHHQSELDFDFSNYANLPVDINANKLELASRCIVCWNRQYAKK